MQGSHDNEYQGSRIMGCDAMQFHGKVLTLWENLLP